MMSIGTKGLTIAASLALSVSIVAQTLPAAVQRSFLELQGAVARAAADDSQQIELQWFTDAGAARTGAPTEDVRVLKRTHGGGPLPRERDPQLSLDHLVVVSSDAAGREVDWRIVPDPRLIRAEFPDEQGRLTSRLLQRSEANLLVAVPDLPDIVRLRVYAAEWMGDAFTLRLIATADLR